MKARALLLLVAGAACLVTFGVAACRAATPPDVGGPAVTALASAAPVVPAPGSTSTSAQPSAGPEVAPRELRIPALKLDATVSAAGVDPATGDFAVPPSIDHVGWYKFGPGATATTGSIVVAGHVDSAAQGAAMRSSPAGVSMIYLDRRAFTVVARERYAKTNIPLEKYFARDGAVRLTLITCGGRFDSKTGHYQDNVVVTATPV